MNDISGIAINQIPFKIKHSVGILLFDEFPSTTIFADEKGIPIVKEWIDCNDNFDRYFIYQTSKQHLKAFIEGKLSHHELYLLADNHIGIVLDQKNGQYHNIKVIASTAIPADYSPSSDYYFKKENGVETTTIIDFFKLDELEGSPATSSLGYVKKIAQYQEYDNSLVASEPAVPYGPRETIKLTGKFRAVNCDTGEFYFKSTTEDNYLGKFDLLLIKKDLEQLTFIDDYEITIERIISRRADAKNQSQDTIISYRKYN